MFQGCTSLVGAVPFDAEKTDVAIANPMNGYFLLPPTPYAIQNTEGTLTFYYDGKQFARTGTYYTIPINNNRPEWAGKPDAPNTSIVRASFDPSFANYLPQSTHAWFEYCTALTDITDMQYLNTSEVRDMNSMFAYCKALKAIDLTHFLTTNAYDMGSLFAGCRALKEIDLSTFRTETVWSMNRLFCDCSALQELDLSMFRTASVNDMSWMFSGCTGIQELDLTHFQTGSVSDMSYMFYYCRNLQTILSRVAWYCSGNSENMFEDCYALEGTVAYDPEKTDVNMANTWEGYFRTERPASYAVLDEAGTLTFYCDQNRSTREGTTYDVPVNSRMEEDGSLTDLPAWVNFPSGNESIKVVDFHPSFIKSRNLKGMVAWFANCRNLTEVRNTQYLNTVAVTNMYALFSGCESLTGVDLSTFNTEQVTSMKSMFENCHALESIDLTGFKTPKVEDMDYMFHGCGVLTTIICPNTWTSSETSAGMFGGCTVLKGAVEFVDSKTNVSMANPNTGYFYRTLEDGIASLRGDQSHDEATYNLGGQRVGRDFRGITVRRGRKVLMK